MIVLAVATLSMVDAFPDEMIRCKVCEKGVHHIWHSAARLRAQCRGGKGDATCTAHHPHENEVARMAREVCDDLPQTYHAIRDDTDFNLVLKEVPPDHSDEVVRAIKNSCLRWLHSHHHHGAEEVAKVIMANIEAGKTTDMILPGLTRKFCRKACGYKQVSMRVSHSHEVHKEPRTGDDEL